MCLSISIRIAFSAGVLSHKRSMTSSFKVMICYHKKEAPPVADIYRKRAIFKNEHLHI